MTPVDYMIFGITQQLDEQESKTKPLIIGSLTAEENETVDCLFDPVQSPQSRSHLASPSASVGSDKDLQRVKKELR